MKTRLLLMLMWLSAGGFRAGAADEPFAPGAPAIRLGGVQPVNDSTPSITSAVPAGVIDALPTIHAFGGGPLKFMVSVDAPLGTHLRVFAGLTQNSGGRIAATLQKNVPVCPELVFDGCTHMTVPCTLPALDAVKRLTPMTLTLCTEPRTPGDFYCCCAVPMLTYPRMEPDAWKKMLATLLTRSGLRRLAVFGDGQGLKRFLRERKVVFDELGEDGPETPDAHTIYVGELLARGEDAANTPKWVGEQPGLRLVLFAPFAQPQMPPGVYRTVRRHGRRGLEGDVARPVFPSGRRSPKPGNRGRDLPPSPPTSHDRRQRRNHAHTMNRPAHVLLPIVAVLLPFAASGAEPPPMTAAVFNFQTTGDALNGKGAETAALLAARLSSAAPEINLVERQELDKIIGEQELGLSGTVTPETAARVGMLTGAKVLVTGRLFDAGGKYYLVAKIIGTETSRVYGESATFGDLGALDGAVGELVPKIVTDLHTHADSLLAPVESPTARLDRLKKIVADHPARPSVSVVIAEQHIGRAVLDPAAQTEIKLLLQQLGFNVLDPAATGQQADVQVTGEAFSELAGRRGNLISCRARVEIKAVRPADGKLLLADRQTGVAVDLAEHTAGKSALENAAATLMDRLIPLLVAN